MVTTEIASIKCTPNYDGSERPLADALLREGQFDEARNVMKAALDALPLEEVDERLACLTLLCKVERGDGNLYEALRILTETYPLSKQASSHQLRAKFHNCLGVTYKQIAETAPLPAYFDKSLSEYQETRFHLEEAGDREGAGYVENNVAMVLCELGRTTEAREHLERARSYFAGQPVKLAEIDETTARICLKECKSLEALSYALDANRVFIQHGEKRLLDDSIRTLLKAAADYQAQGDSKTL